MHLAEKRRACATPKAGLKSKHERFRTIGARAVGVALALGVSTAVGRGPVRRGGLRWFWFARLTYHRRKFYLELGLVAGGGLYSALGSLMVLRPLVLAVAAFG